MLTSREIRQQFIDYFVERQGHTAVPSSPVVPADDPTLLFANAGMNQFKDVFLGTGKRPYTRAVDTQKCIRAGGKHNDLEDVGKDTYHHTFFEMLGNWSFGDYFKKEAITWAWDLLTNVWGLEKDRLHATVFGGDEEDGLERDEEAAELWRTATDIDPSHIHYCDKKDNFWEMGDTGPCGPCSEIHYDNTPDKSGGKLVNADDARVIEIWNLVFIQFNRNTDKSLAPLPAKHVDTGMGFERITAVLQGKASNYDTDVFTPLFDAIREETGAREYSGKLDDAIDIAYRVIGDHIRTLTFALTDGAVPSNEGRGYVLRRILRRAVRHGRQTLGMTDAFLHRLVPTVVETMSDAFPELRDHAERTTELILEEEESFGRTLDRGIALFEEAAGRAKGGVLSGDDAFVLYDTYGFPIDLTELMAEERGLRLDRERYEERMAQQKEQSRGTGGGANARATLVELVQQLDPPATEFVGDGELEHDASTYCYVFVEGDDAFRPAESASAGSRLALVTGSTPFYSEAGGQVGDRGTIRIGDAVFEVEDTIRVGATVFHLGTLAEGEVRDVRPGGGDVAIRFEVDAPRREKIMANHTATHLLNHGLRGELGEQVAQKGSLVDDEKTRFDFSHNKAVATDQLRRIEEAVNRAIDADLPVYAEVADQEDALKIHGLRAVFGEKYPPRVRVVSVGVPVGDLLGNPENAKWYDYSVEFCGGTHLATTGQAKRFAVLGEEAVAKGIRRVTCVTGERATTAVETGERLAKKAEALRSADPERLSASLTEIADELARVDVPVAAASAIRETLSELQEIVKQRAKERTKAAQGGVVDRARAIAERVDGPLTVAAVEGADGKLLRSAMDVITKKCPDTALLLGAADDEKCFFLAAVPEALIAKGLRAGDWVREVAKVAGGGGGGKPDRAQAGGKDPAKLDAALEAGRAFAAAKLGE